MGNAVANYYRRSHRGESCRARIILQSGGHYSRTAPLVVDRDWAYHLMEKVDAKQFQTDVCQADCPGFSRWHTCMGIPCFQRNKRRYGGYIVHIGIVLVYIGILGSKGYFLLESKGLQLEESMEVGKYTLTLKNAFQEEHPNFSLGGVVLAVEKGGRSMGTMRPARAFYHKAGQGDQDTIESAIRHFGLNDLYIALGPLPENVPAHVQSGGIVSVQAYHNPLVNVVWLGVTVMVIGGLVAIFEKHPKGNV